MMKKILISLCCCYTAALHAACPIAPPSTIGTVINEFAQMNNGRKLYFCQQNFNLSTRSIALSSLDVSSFLQGPTKAINLNNPSVVSVPFDTASVVISGGGSPQALPLNGTPESDFPTPPAGHYNKASIFNIYVRVNASNNCLRWQRKIKRYLRNHPSLFSSKSPTGNVKLAVGINSGNNFAKISDIELGKANGKIIKGELVFVHTNPGNGQFFTDQGTNKRMCWFGVKTHLKVDFGAYPPEQSGLYDVEVRFND